MGGAAERAGGIASYHSNLDAIKRIVKLNGWVASAEGFTHQPGVVDGASLLLEEIFGEASKHARAAAKSTVRISSTRSCQTNELF